MNTFSSHKNYWFTIEPYVYTFIRNNKLLLLNTLDNSFIEEENLEVIELVRRTQNEKNLSVSLLLGEKLKNDYIYNFISKIRDKFMGDIIDTSLSAGKPIQFISRTNLLDKEQLLDIKNEFFNILPMKEYINNITFILNSSDSCKLLLKEILLFSGKENFEDQLFLNDVKYTFNSLRLKNDTNIHITGLNIYKNPDIIEIIQFFKIKKSKVFYYVALENIEETDIIEDNLFIIVNIVKHQNNIDRIQKAIERFKDAQFIFLIESLENLDFVEGITNKKEHIKFQIVPLYTIKNKNFFEQHIYVTKEDILSMPHNLKSIFIKNLVNLNYFGKLFINNDKKIYTNFNENENAIGNIGDELTLNKFVKSSWFKIRNQPPCNNCLYQFLCSSPSNYENEIGKPNLCHVHR